MSTKHLPLLVLTALLLSPIAGCGSKPKAKVEATPSPSPVISVTKPINKAKDTKSSFEQLGKQHEQMNPEAPEPAKP
jgi:type IV pilus biogenesis protein CpaD/CtpE